MKKLKEKSQNLWSELKGSKIPWRIAAPVIVLSFSLAAYGSYQLINPEAKVAVSPQDQPDASNSPSPKASASASPKPSVVYGKFTPPEHQAGKSAPMSVVKLCGNGGGAVPQKLLQASGNNGGAIAGYARCSPISRARSWWQVASAEAASPTYSPIVFYVKPVSGIDQVFVYSLTTNTETQLTSEGDKGAFRPVFSSQSQQISYAHTIANSSFTRAELVIGDMATGQTTRLAPAGNQRYQPTAWSPDGRKLLYTVMDDLVPPPNGPRIKVFVYDLATGASTELPPPAAGLNDISGYDNVIWRDNTTVHVQYANHSGGDYINRQEYLVNVNTLAATPFAGIPHSGLQYIASFGDSLYAVKGYTDRQLQKAPMSNPTQVQNIPGASGIGTFQLRLNSAGDALAGIIFITGEGGSQNMKIKSVPPAGGTAQELLAPPESYSAVLLGWGLDYDSLLWLSYDSGKSSIHLLNLNNNSDSILVDGLQLIQ